MGPYFLDVSVVIGETNSRLVLSLMAASILTVTVRANETRPLRVITYVCWNWITELSKFPCSILDGTIFDCFHTTPQETQAVEA